MNITLSERKCQQCGVKLSEFEIQEKAGHCIDCYNEIHDVNPKKKNITQITRTKSKQFVSIH